jgi:hypothetical protein
MQGVADKALKLGLDYVDRHYTISKKQNRDHVLPAYDVFVAL